MLCAISRRMVTLQISGRRVSLSRCSPLPPTIVLTSLSRPIPPSAVAIPLLWLSTATLFISRAPRMLLSVWLLTTRATAHAISLQWFRCRDSRNCVFPATIISASVNCADTSIDRGSDDTRSLKLLFINDIHLARMHRTSADSLLDARADSIAALPKDSVKMMRPYENRR